jgi:arylsulfatase A
MKSSRTHSAYHIATVILASTIGFTNIAFAQPGADGSRPNILFFFADDQGWNDTSVPMDDGIPGSKSDFYRTPNIERIAAWGMRFSNAYAAAPMCGPSRSSFHIGKGAARAAYSATTDEVHASSMTIGEMMQSAGYATAHFGKWSPGPPTAGLQFFDTSDGAQGNGDGTVSDPRNPKDIFGIVRRQTNGTDLVPG